MSRYILRRVLVSIGLLWFIVTFLFLFVHILPGDPANVILGGHETREPTPEQLERVRARLGLNRPLHEQYFSYLGGLARGDLGNSFRTGHPVGPLLFARLGRTIQLVIPTIVLSASLGIVIGVLAASVSGRWSDGLLSTIALIGTSLPVFVVASLLVLVVSVNLGLLPSFGYVEFTSDPRRFLILIILPVTALTLSRIAPVMRMTRMAMLEILMQDYVRTARAKGLSPRAVTYVHVLRNALLPVVSIIGLQVGNIFGGALLVEIIFSWPGINQLLLASVHNRDFPVIQGVVLLISVIVILVNLATDIAYAVVDPRIRYN